MGITVNPTFVPAAPALVAVSPDGILSAKVDGPNAGVLLWADYSASAPTPQKVRFYRGDGSLVRSGDPAWAPGGVATAYDHEASIGSAAAYYAVPQDTAGVAGARSATVAVQVPLTADPADPRKRTWLKAVGRPDLSMRVRVASFTESDRDTAAQTSRIQGAQYPNITRDRLSALTGQIVVRTDTEADYDLMLAMLDETNALLLQPPPEAGVKPLYLVVTSGGAAGRLGDSNLGWRMRLWPLNFVESPRPATLDAPFRIPGLSWDTVVDTYPTWTELAAQNDSWLSLLGGS